MKVLTAPDSYKGSLTAMEVARAMERGIKKVSRETEVVKVPMADGGEGTVQSLVDATGGRIVKRKVTGPLGEEVEAYYGILGEGKTAVIEMASASGLPLVPEDQKNPLKTTTYGTGELIKDALEQNMDRLIIGIGGSATNDAGVGMAQALGVSFLDKNGEEIGFGGGQLSSIERINTEGIHPGIQDVRIEVACDVNNPLYGPDGAAHVYAPQKGANEQMVETLDENLKYFDKVVKRELNIDVQSIPGAGAAGGLGAGLVAFLNGELRSGIDIVLEVNQLSEKLQGVDLVLTGEGKMDGQTIKGKTPIGVAREARKKGIPVIAINGMVGTGLEPLFEEGIDAAFSIVRGPMSLEQALQDASALVEQTSEQVLRTIMAIRKS